VYRLGLKSLSFNMAIMFGRQVVAGLLGLITAALIARVYGPEGNGMFAIALLMPGMLGALLNFGIAPANVYFIASSQVTVRETVKVNLRIWLWLSLIGLMIGAAILVWKGRELFPGVNPTLLWLALPTYPLTLLSGFFTSIFLGLQEFRTYNKILILQPIVLLLSLCLILLSGHKEMELLIGVQLITYLVVLVVVILYVSRLYYGADDINIVAGDYGKKAFGYGWKANLGSILAFINYKADIFLVNIFLAPAAAGIYVVAVTLSEKLWVVSTAASTVLAPRISQLASDEDARKRLTPLVSRVVLLITLICTIVLAIIARPLIAVLFGDQYVDSALPLLLLLPGIFILGVAKVWANDIGARGRPEINMYISLAALFFNIIGNVILIPRFGLAGAAIATTISYFICSTVTLFVYVRMTSNKWVDTLFVNLTDIKLLMKVISK
jgi:O-antigen/teichoic acid export membrane protein